LDQGLSLVQVVGMTVVVVSLVFVVRHDARLHVTSDET